MYGIVMMNSSFSISLSNAETYCLNPNNLHQVNGTNLNFPNSKISSGLCSPFLFGSRTLSSPPFRFIVSNPQRKKLIDRHGIISAHISNNPITHSSNSKSWKTWIPDSNSDSIPNDWGSSSLSEINQFQSNSNHNHSSSSFIKSTLMIGIVLAAISAHGFLPRLAFASPNLTVSSVNNRTKTSGISNSDQTESLEIRKKKFEKEISALTQKLRREQAQVLLDLASSRQKITSELLPLEIEIEQLELKFARFRELSSEFKSENDGNSDPTIENKFQNSEKQLTEYYIQHNKLRKKLEEEDMAAYQKVFSSLPEEYAKREKELLKQFDLVESNTSESQIQNQIESKSRSLDSVFMDSHVKKILKELSERNKLSMEKESFSITQALAFSLGVNIELDVIKEKGDVIRKGREDEWIGWIKWAMEKKEEKKNALLNDAELANQYVKKKQADILRTRDLILSQSFFNKKERRWELPFHAIIQSSKSNLISNARVRFDKRAMWTNLKGDDRPFFSSLTAFDSLTHHDHAVDSLMLNLQLRNVPTSIEVMWIPLNELDSTYLLTLPFKIVKILCQNVYGHRQFQQIWRKYNELLVDSSEEIFLRFIYPSMPSGLRVLFQLEYPSTGVETETLVRNLNWLNEAQTRFQNKKLNSPWPWVFSLPPRAFLSYYPPWLVLSYLLPVFFSVFFTLPYPENDVSYKRRLDNLIQIIARKSMDEMKLRPVEVAGGYLFRGRNPIKRAFDNAQRIRRPKNPLSSFPGIQPLLKDINEIIIFLKNPKQFLDLGARPPRGVLIHGSVQKGTRELAQAISAEAQVPIVELESIDFAAKDFVGQGAATVRDVFKQAREMAPVIICVNDFERVAPVRGSTMSAGKQEIESMINQFLVELDGFESQAGVVLLALTENPQKIDPALTRPGRMDRVLVLPKPTIKERENMLRKYAKQYMDPRFESIIDWEMVSEKTAHLNPDDLEMVPQNYEPSAVLKKIYDVDELSIVLRWMDLYNSIIPISLRKSKFFQSFEEKVVHFLGLNITEEDVKNVYERMDYTSITHPMMELNPPQYPWTRKFKYPHAVWAAGRGLLAALIPNFVTVENIWLNKHSWNGIGFTKFAKRESAKIRSRSSSEKHLVLLFGSHISARLFLEWGESNNLATKELRQAQKIAAKMVLQHGWSPKNSTMVYSVPNSDRSLVMGDNFSEELSEDATLLYKLACEKAAYILQKNHSVLEELIEILCEEGGIDNKNLQALLDKHNAKPEDEPFFLASYDPNDIAFKDEKTYASTIN